MSNMAVSAYNPYLNVASVAPSNYQPYSPVVSDTGSTGGTFGLPSDYASMSSMAANAAGGGFASFKVSAQMAESMKTLFGKGSAPAPAPGAPPASNGVGQNLMAGAKGIAISGLKGAGLAALVGAGVSAVANGVGVATGKVDKSQAVTNVTKDTITSAVGGLGAVTVGGLGSIAMGALRIGGMPATILTVGLGAVGGVLGGQLAKKITDNF